MIYALTIFTLIILASWIFIKNHRYKFAFSLLIILSPLLIFFMNGAKIYALALFIPSYLFILFNNYRKNAARDNYKGIIVAMPFALLMLWLLQQNRPDLIKTSNSDELMISIILAAVLIFTSITVSLIGMARTKGDRTYD